MYSSKKKTNFPITSIVISTTLSIFVSGLLGIMLLHSKSVSRVIRDNIKIFIYLDRGVNDKIRSNIYNQIISQKFILVKEGIQQVNYISKEEAAKTFNSESTENFWEILDKNPLRDTFIIAINHNFQKKYLLEAIKTRLEKINGIYEVNYAENLTHYVNTNFKKIKYILWIFSLILFFTVIVMIKNTIKLALYSQRFLIRSMQLVGAFPSFIIRPFIIRYLFIGIYSALLAILMILVILEYVNIKSDSIAKLQKPNDVFLLLLFLLFSGVVVNVFATYVSVNKYLKSSLDDLY